MTDEAPEEQLTRRWSRRIGDRSFIYSISRTVGGIFLYNCECLCGEARESAPPLTRSYGPELTRYQVEQLFADFVAKRSGS